MAWSVSGYQTLKCAGIFIGRFSRWSLRVSQFVLVALLAFLSLASVVACFNNDPPNKPAFIQLGNERWTEGPIYLRIWNFSRSWGIDLQVRGRWIELQQYEKNDLRSETGGDVLRSNVFGAGQKSFGGSVASFGTAWGYHVVPADWDNSTYFPSWDLRDGQWLKRSESFLRGHGPAWIFAVAFALYPVWFLLYSPRRRTKKRRVRGLCLKCGYNLTGNTSGTCPECGARA